MVISQNWFVEINLLNFDNLLNLFLSKFILIYFLEVIKYCISKNILKQFI